MKTIVQFMTMTASARAKSLADRVRKDDIAKKEIAKILIAAEESGDFGKGEMNAYAQKVTGVELRRECQGAYESVNVLRAIRASQIDFSEEEFDSAPKFGLIKLSGFIGKNNPALVSEAIAIIRSRVDVTNRLKALGQKPKAEKPESGEKPSSGEGAGESLNSGTSAPKGATFFVPEGTSILAVPEIQARILEDLRKAPDSESCEAYHEFLKGLVGHLHSRWEMVEAEEAKANKKRQKRQKVAA